MLEVGSSALHVAAAPATYLSSDTMFCRYSATDTFIDKAFRSYLINELSIKHESNPNLTKLSHLNTICNEGYF